MLLQGSCHCGTVRFTVEAQSPVPFMHRHFDTPLPKPAEVIEAALAHRALG